MIASGGGQIASAPPSCGSSRKRRNGRQASGLQIPPVHGTNGSRRDGLYRAEASSRLSPFTAGQCAKTGQGGKAGRSPSGKRATRIPGAGRPLTGWRALPEFCAKTVRPKMETGRSRAYSRARMVRRDENNRGPVTGCFLCAVGSITANRTHSRAESACSQCICTTVC